jgi:hypothetical protein
MQRVEQQLAVLAAHVALAEARVALQDVVAVDAAAAREDAVVEAEQRDDAVRHRAHRHHGADGQLAGAEVGARRAGPASRPASSTRRSASRSSASPPCSAASLSWRRACASCQASSSGGGGQQLQRLAQRVDPGVDRLRALQPLNHRLEPFHQLGEAAGQVDVTAVHVVERQGEAQPRQSLSSAATPSSSRSSPVSQVFCGTRCSENACPLLQAEPPADPGAGRPVAQPLEVLVAEAEQPAHRRRRGEVEPPGWR